jgi:hypothetical protein
VKKSAFRKGCFINPAFWFCFCVLEGKSQSQKLNQIHPKARSMSQIVGSWLWAIGKEEKQLVLLGAAATWLSLWLCRDNLVFDKKK